MSKRPRGKVPAKVLSEAQSLRARAANAERAGDHHAANRMRTHANALHRKGGAA